MIMAYTGCRKESEAFGMTCIKRWQVDTGIITTSTFKMANQDKDIDFL